MSHHSGMVASCWQTGKLGYDTRQTAKRALKRSAADYGEPQSAWNAYRCEACWLFHIGHRSRQEADHG